MGVNTPKQKDRSGFTFPTTRLDAKDLAKKIKSTFDQMGYRSLRDVHCETDGDRITLKGKTTTFYLKQLAQETASRVAGVDSVDNQIEVVE